MYEVLTKMSVNNMGEDFGIKTRAFRSFMGTCKDADEETKQAYSTHFCKVYSIRPSSQGMCWVIFELIEPYVKNETPDRKYFLRLMGGGGDYEDNLRYHRITFPITQYTLEEVYQQLYKKITR